MIKRIISLILSVSVVTGTVLLCPASASAEEYLYGYIQNAVASEDDFGNFRLFLLIVDDNENRIQKHTYNGVITVNGQAYDMTKISYSDIETLTEALAEGVFSRYTVNAAGEVSDIDYDNTVQNTYTNTEYDKSKNSFDISGIDGGLPIYYRVNIGNQTYPRYAFKKPFLDEQNVYDIEVCKYAIIVTDINAKKGTETITQIKTYPYMDPWFDQHFGIEINIKSTDDYENLSHKAHLEYDIWDEQGNLIDERGWADAWEESIIKSSVLPDASAKYTVRIRLIRCDSKDYTEVEFTYQSTPIPILRGRVIAANICENDFGEGILAVKIRLADGTEGTLCCSAFYADGDHYDPIEMPEEEPNALEELAQTLMKYESVKFTVYPEDPGEIAVISEDTDWSIDVEFKRYIIDEMEASAHFDIKNIKEPCFAVMAVYDKNGVIIGLDSIELTVWDYAISFLYKFPTELESTEGVHAKVLFWNPTNLKPIGRRFEFE